MHCRGERDRRAGQRGETRTPDAARDHHLLHLDRTARSHHGADPRAAEGRARHLQAGDLGVVQHGEHASPLRPLAHDGARTDRVDHRHARRVEAAQDHVAVHERRLRDDLDGREQLGLDAPGARGCHPPAQFLPARLGARHLDPAARGIDAERGILALALQGQHRDLAIVIGGKDEVRRVAGGSAGIGQRPLVDQQQVLPPELRQMLDQAIADDPGADHGDRGPRRKRSRGASGDAAAGVFHGRSPRSS